MKVGMRIKMFGSTGTIIELSGSLAKVRWDPPLGHESWKAVTMLQPVDE